MIAGEKTTAIVRGLTGLLMPLKCQMSMKHPTTNIVARKAQAFAKAVNILIATAPTPFLLIIV